jgi:hypothetical protein
MTVSGLVCDRTGEGDRVAVTGVVEVACDDAWPPVGSPPGDDGCGMTRPACVLRTLIRTPMITAVPTPPNQASGLCQRRVCFGAASEAFR